VHGLPEDVSAALGDHGDALLSGSIAARENQGQGERGAAGEHALNNIG
jgi:hypothetical protein